MAAANWELLEAHRHAVTSFLRGKCPREEDVEDCVQEAMLRVAQLADLDRGRLRGLLKTVAYNVAMDMHRERARQAVALARIGAFSAPAPDAVVLDSFEARHLASHAQHLSFKERAALRGRVDGFAPRETAALLGATPRSVHLALSRARTSLRRLAEVAGALLIVLRRHGQASVRLLAPSLVAVTVGLVMAAPHLERPQGGSLRASVSPPGVAIPGWHASPPTAQPGAGPTALGPVPHAAAAPGPVAALVDSGWASKRLTLMAMQAAVSPCLNPSTAMVEAIPNTPLLNGIQHLLTTGAAASGPHRVGCG